MVLVAAPSSGALAQTFPRPLEPESRDIIVVTEGLGDDDEARRLFVSEAWNEVEAYEDRYGVSSDVAVDNLLLQADLNTRADDLLRSLEADASSFAGFEFINSEHLYVRLYVTEAATAEKFAREYHYPGRGFVRFEVVEVAYSGPQLDSELSRLASDIGLLETDDVEVALLAEALELYVDHRINRIVVRYDSDAPVSTIETLLANPMVVVEKVDALEAADESCTVASCNQARGGLKMNSSGGAGFCTMGFNARRSVGGFAYPGFVTAGHCLDNQSSTYHRWPGPTPSAGNMLYSTTFAWEDNATSDSAFSQGLYSPWSGGSYNTIERNLTTNLSRTITSIASSSAGLGTQICRSGYRTAENCGELISTNATHGGTGNLLRLEHVPACAGDSGGPYYGGNVAYGVHKGSNGGTSCPGPWWEDSFGTKATVVQTRMGVTIYTTSS